ncbi:MAG TPA: penicillin-binding protein 2 [Mycobacteriales bacterium]|nr:penicillin-binding protein 2 [Mycobacteriales bacterium]HWB66755.1 penicillin-binding protein 2 [Mycobacteriales bacterium]
MLLVTMMLTSLIAARLVQLQGVDRAAYSAAAQEQRLHTVTLTATRGSITDRSGDPLAETVDARDVVADPSEIDHPATVAAALSPVLGIKPAKLVPLLTGTSEYSRLAAAVSPAVGDAVDALDLTGISTPDTSRRVYPDGRLASNVIGFVDAQGEGRGGLEYEYQKQLAGHNGVAHYEVAADGAPIPDGEDVETAAVPGEGIRLTLQRDIQFEAQQAIAAQVKATGALSGTVIVMNPKNGQIYALAVAPGFNPNDLSTANSADLGDPAVTDAYEPGSVIKAVTVSAALQNGLVTPTSKFVIPNTYQYDGTTFHDAENHGTEHLTLTGILAYSSNIGAIQIAKRVGPDRLYDYLRAFGFGQTTGVDLPGESPGLLLPVDQWSGTTLPTLAFGQGLGVTAMQVASLYSTIANNGVRVTPTLIEGTTDAKGTYHAAPAPSRRRVISAGVATEMRQILESVTTNEGTAPAARIPGYRIAGKTGTANRSNGHGGYSGAGYDATFVGMVPADNPKLVCEVLLERPIRGYFGGQVAAPVFKTVMSFALRTLGIAPTFTKAAHAALTW